MAQGLLREAWQPPRDLHAERPFLGPWLARWRAWSGAAQRQTQADIEAVQASQQRAEALDAQALGQAIRQCAARLRFLGDGPPASGPERQTWLGVRSELLGLWCRAAHLVLGMRPHATQVRRRVKGKRWRSA